MTIEFDEKGKFFTDIITKTPIPAWIQTTAHRIHGNIHVSQDRRIKDELDLPESFVAITDAVVYLADGQVLFRTKFLAVRRAEIIWVLPENEIEETAEGNPA